jgi:hypothetical protein
MFGWGARRCCRANFASRSALPERGGQLVPFWISRCEHRVRGSNAPHWPDAGHEAGTYRHPVRGDHCRLRPPSGQAGRRGCPCAIGIKGLPVGERTARAATCARLRVQGIRPQDRGSRRIRASEARLRAAVLPARGEACARPSAATAGIEKLRNQAGTALGGRHAMTGRLPERQASHPICIFLP